MIHISQAHSVRTITLARAEKRNALTPAMCDQLHDAIVRTHADAEARALLLTGEGDVFCAGFDLSLCKDDATVLPALLAGLSRIVLALRMLDIPVVISAHGGAIAGGCALLCGGDIVLTTSDAKLGYPVLRLGISPAVSVPTLRACIGAGPSRARTLDTGLISGSRAVEIGLAHEALATRDACEARTLAIAHEATCKPAHALAQTKRWLREVEAFDPALSEQGLATSLALTTGDELAAMLPLAWTKR